ncbi:hypothetical protein C7B62_21060 [Pleurocapsa sp. CCALA 161]|nr:hypothetical protein C7B62_21060 [Pleurocapsa sp. CCALA 161]
MDNKNFPVDSNGLLNSCIQLKFTRISPKVTIPQQVCFRLDGKLLEQIAHNQANQVKLAVSATNLANLRHYTLLNLPWSQPLTFTQSSLTFSTEYSLDNQQPSTILFRSTISLEGKISQQIKQELAHNPSLLKQISQAHYWLIAEILAQLPFKSKAGSSWLLVGFLAIAMVVINILIWYLIPLNYLTKLSICLGIFLLLKLLLTRLIKHQLKYWIIYHLLDRLSANSGFRQRIGLKVMSFLL